MTAVAETTRRGRGSAASRRRRGSGAAGPTLFEDLGSSRPLPAVCEAASAGPSLGGEPTLADLVGGVWEGLAVQGHAECLVCGGEMVAVFGAHARPAAGRCGECGTTLS